MKSKQNQLKVFVANEDWKSPLHFHTTRKSCYETILFVNKKYPDWKYLAVYLVDGNQKIAEYSNLSNLKTFPSGVADFQ